MHWDERHFACIFLLGLLERGDHVVLEMGDSRLVLVVYFMGLGGFYDHLR